jgi:hypothetical protein
MAGTDDTQAPVDPAQGSGALRPAGVPAANPIVVRGKPGSIAVEQIGDRPVVYTGEDTPAGQAPDTLEAALRRVLPDDHKHIAPLPASAEPEPALLLGMSVQSAPLDASYARHADERETADLRRQLGELNDEDRHVSLAQGSLDVLKDVSKGVALAVPEAITGAKHAVNNTLDLVEHIADQIPGPIVSWGDTDANPRTDNGLRVEFKSGSQFKAENKRITRFLPKFALSSKDEPDTVTGKVIEGLAQFGTGMAGAGGALKGITAATRAGRIGKAMAEGALADFSAFDAHQQRLSDVLRHVAPDKAKPIFDYLASNAEDPELVGRLKNAVEGLGLGVAAEGVFAGIRALKAARLAKSEVRRAAKAAGHQVDPVATSDELRRFAEESQAQIKARLGDEADTGPLVRFMGKVARQTTSAARSAQSEAKGLLEASAEPNAFNINFARIDTPDDVKAVISSLLHRYAGDVDTARRGIRTWHETQAAAGRLDWVTSMGERRTGDAVNAETALAYRVALNASGKKLLELARTVRDQPSVPNQYAFRRMMSVHRAIQAEFMGARAEAGRALNAFKIPAGTPDRTFRQMDALLADTGGANASQELAKRLLQASEKGDAALNTFVQQGWMARSRSLIKLVYTNSLLSGTGTAAINVAGNVSSALMMLASRAVSPRLARAAGAEPATEVGEAAAIIHGWYHATRDMFRLNPAKTWEDISEDGFARLRQDGIFRGAAPGIDAAAPKGIRLRSEREEAGASVGQLMEQRPLSAAAWGLSEDTPLGRFLDVTQMVVEGPSNLNATADDFFKVIAARGEIHAQAFRQAMREARDGLHATPEQIRTRLSELVDNPTDDMLEAAEREMHELTFTRSDGKISKAMTDVRRVLDSVGPIPFGTFLLPFLRTPANLISLAMRYSPLAPLMARFRDELLAGGARAEIAKAQMAIGTALWSVWLGEALDGKLTGRGPVDKAQREALMRADEFGGVGWQPYSMKVGERWVAFDRLDPPWGTGMSLVADLGELIRNDDYDAAHIQDGSELTGHVVASLGQAFFDRSSFMGALSITEALTSNDTNKAERAMMSLAAGAVPASGLLRNFRRGEDPYLRETHDVVTAMMNVVPTLSEKLPPQRDLWGRVRTYQTGLGSLYDAALPLQTKEVGATAIDLEMQRLGMAVPMPQRALSIDGQRVSLRNHPELYSEYVRLAGEPAFKELEAVVRGNHRDADYYGSLSEGPDGEKAQYIKDVIRAHRDDARDTMMQLHGAELKDLAAAATAQRERLLQ